MDTADRNFMCLDFETLNSTPGNSNALLIPYLLILHSYNAETNEKENVSLYLPDYNDHEEMINFAIKLMVKHHKHNALFNRAKYNLAYEKYLKEFEVKAKYIKLKNPDAILTPKARRDDWANLLIYSHNLGSFDGTFLMKYIIEYFAPNVEILRDDNHRLISMRVVFLMNIKDEVTGKRTKKALSITFLDSLRLLPSSLQKLSNSFSDGDKSLVKTSFDHKKINMSNLLFYKEEVINYCIRDCEALHNIIKKFNQLIYKNWNTVIWNLPSISSVAFNIYRTKFIPEDLIPQISGSIFDFMRKAFFGGATEMYKPYHLYQDENKFIYSYDVNSLYPNMMKDVLLPCGDIIYFEGNILEQRPGKLAICYCEIKAPLDLDQPFLPVHINNKSVTGVGEFEGVYYSRDIIHAISLGYEIKIINGYYFTRSEKLFERYVDDLYQMRLTYPKDDPMNLISKLLLNSLYGRMAMDDRHASYTVYDKKEFEKLMRNKAFQDKFLNVENFSKDKVLVQTKYDNFKNEFNSNYEQHMTSIGIAAAITSEARIFMQQFKNHPELKLYYTDTDSIYVDKDPQEMNKLFPGIISSSELGKLKHEYTIVNAIFLAPKCYWLQLSNGENVIRIKGVKKQFIDEALANYSLTFEKFANLLIKNEIIQIEQDKWFRDFTNANISISKQAHTIKQNQNKRELIYEGDFCIDTKPIVFEKQSFNAQISKKFLD